MKNLGAHGDSHSVSQQVDSLQHERTSVGPKLDILSVGSGEVRSQGAAHGPHLLHHCW